MSYDDMFDLNEENKQLKLELEEVKTEKDVLHLTYMFLQDERMDMIYAYREAKIILDEYETALKDEVWQPIKKNADKKWTEWIKDKHNIEKIKVAATIKP